MSHEASKVGQPQEVPACHPRCLMMSQRCARVKHDCMGNSGVKSRAPAIKHLKTSARDKMRLVKTMRCASVAFHLNLAKVGQTAKHLNDGV